MTSPRSDERLTLLPKAEQTSDKWYPLLLFCRGLGPVSFLLTIAGMFYCLVYAPRAAEGVATDVMQNAGCTPAPITNLCDSNSTHSHLEPCNIDVYPVNFCCDFLNQTRFTEVCHQAEQQSVEMSQSHNIQGLVMYSVGAIFMIIAYLSLFVASKTKSARAQSGHTENAESVRLTALN